MNIRPKTLRRLLFVFACFAMLVLLAAGIYMRSAQKGAQRIGKLRAEGMALYQDKNYAEACPLLGEYFYRSHTQDTDAEALFAYGKSRVSVPMPRDQHLREARGIFEHYLELRPDDVAAQHELIDVYQRIGYDKEAMALATKLLAKNPSDAIALKAEFKAYSNQKKWPEALAAAEKLTTLDPLDVNAHAMIFYCLSAINGPDLRQNVLTRGQTVLRDHPDDPRAELIAAYAYATAASGQGPRQADEDRAQARKYLKQAASRPPGDAEFILLLVNALEREGYDLFDESLNLLTAAQQKDSDPRILRLYVQRIWERGDREGVISRLQGLDPKSEKSDSRLLGYRALALCEMKRNAEAEPVLSALTARSDDNVAQAWAGVLRTEFSGAAASAAERLKPLTEAARLDPSNAFIHLRLAGAYAQLGETELAMREWSQAASRAPSWVAPAYYASRALAQSGRFPEALRIAETARRRDPGNDRAQVAYAIAWDGLLRSPAAPKDPEEPRKLFSFVEEIQNIWKSQAPKQDVPAVEPETIAIYVRLLAAGGKRDQAIAAINTALASKPALPAEFLIQLAAASEAEHLEMEQTILDAAEKSHGLIPQVALSRALELHQKGKAQEGLQIIQSAVKSHASDPAWQIALADYREATADPDALKTWIDLGDKNPRNVSVQYAVLRARSREADRDFWARTIERVKELSSVDGNVWKLEQARWLLAGPPEKDSTSAAVALLREVASASPLLAEPHQLLADALLRAGDRPEAIKELKVASSITPGDLAIVARLTRLLAADGNFDEARKLLEGLAADSSLTLGKRRWVERAFAEQGDTKRAIELLSADNPGTPDPSRDAMLADLYRRTGRRDKAEVLYRQVLDQPTADPNALTDAADFFAAQNQLDVARQYLARLGEIHSEPGTMELVTARFEERYGSAEKAAASYLAATRIKPHAEQAWMELAGFHLRQRHFKEAADAIEQGLRAAPGAALPAMKDALAPLQGLKNPEDAQPLIEVISHDPRNTAAGEMLKTLTAAQARGESPQETLPRLRVLADRYVDFLPLQMQVIRSYVVLGRFKEAEEVALRASTMFRTNPEPSRMLAGIHAASGNYEAARREARHWKELSDLPLAPDLFIADTFLAQKQSDAAQALQQLSPYMQGTVPQREAALPLYSRALIASGRSDKAATLLEPHWNDSPQWRVVSLNLATAFPDSAAAGSWIRRIAPLVPGDSANERLALASAWQRVGERFGDRKSLETARDTLAPLMADPKASATIYFLAATNAQALEDYSTAAANYRRVLQIAPNEPGTQNNLAFVLLLGNNPADLPAALQLAQSAIQGRPNNPTFYDTLARIYDKLGRSKEAADSFRTALKYDPNSVEVMIGLADILARNKPDRTEAATLLTRIATAMDGGTTISAMLQKQLDAARESLKR